VNGYIKHFGYNVGITYKRIEVDGRKIVGVYANSGLSPIPNKYNSPSADTGIFTNDASLSRRDWANFGRWMNDGVVIDECYIHHTGKEGMYLGGNYYALSSGIAHLPEKNFHTRNTRIEYCGSGCMQYKTKMAGTNSIENCVFLYAGLNYAVEEAGHGNAMSFTGHGYIRNNIIYESAESGLRAYMDDGPVYIANADTPGPDSSTGYFAAAPEPDDYQNLPGNTLHLRHSGHECSAVYDLEISNNIVIRGGVNDNPLSQQGHGISVSATPTGLPAPSAVFPESVNMARFRPRIFSNTIIDAETNGINLGNVASGGIVANNIVLNSASSDVSGTSGQTVQGNVASGTPSNMFVVYVPLASASRNIDNGDDLHLKTSVGPAIGTRGTHYTATDRDGDSRGTGATGTIAPDAGAYEYP